MEQRARAPHLSMIRWKTPPFWQAIDFREAVSDPSPKAYVKIRVYFPAACGRRAKKRRRAKDGRQKRGLRLPTRVRKERHIGRSDARGLFLRLQHTHELRVGGGVRPTVLRVDEPGRVRSLRWGKHDGVRGVASILPRERDKREWEVQLSTQRSAGPLSNGKHGPDMPIRHGEARAIVPIQEGRRHALRLERLWRQARSVPTQCRKPQGGWIGVMLLEMVTPPGSNAVRHEPDLPVRHEEDDLGAAGRALVLDRRVLQDLERELESCETPRNS